jgi:glycosyltransferase involved in cell wall biosynthesis
VQAFKFAILIPCFNEEATIGGLVLELRRQAEWVYVVDDGSSDSTCEEAQKNGARVLKNLSGKGKGAALNFGFSELVKTGFEWVLTMDGDGQHDPRDVPQFFTKTADLVIGNRMGQAEKMDSVRRFVNRWMSRQISKRVGIEIPDSQCGMRLIRCAALKDIIMREHGFAFESEMILAFAGSGLKIDFVPIQCLRAKRPSRIHPIADTWRWFRWWLRR